MFNEVDQFDTIIMLFNIQKPALTSYDLKVIAMVTMLIDHIGVMFFPKLMLLRIIGRIAFVLFTFLLVEGFFHTRNLKVYLGAILLAAILSELPYDLAFSGKWFNLGRQNVLFTLGMGIIAMMVMKSSLAGDLKVLFVYLIMVLNNYMGFDYYYLGILQIVFFYLYRASFFKKAITVTILNLFYFFRITVQSIAFIGLIPIYLYNGERGKKSGWVFYTFYGLHLLILGLIKKYLL